MEKARHTSKQMLNVNRKLLVVEDVRWEIHVMCHLAGPTSDISQRNIEDDALAVDVMMDLNSSGAF